MPTAGHLREARRHRLHPGTRTGYHYSSSPMGETWLVAAGSPPLLTVAAPLLSARSLQTVYLSRVIRKSWCKVKEARRGNAVLCMHAGLSWGAAASNSESPCQPSPCRSAPQGGDSGLRHSHTTVTAAFYRVTVYTATKILRSELPGLVTVRKALGFSS